MASSKKYTNNASGKMNMMHQTNKNKQIDLDDFDVQMITPQFLSSKTLTKPLKQYEINLSKTNPNGVMYDNKKSYQIPTKQYPEVVIFKKDQQRTSKNKQPSLSQIDASNLNIQPAYKKNQSNDFQFKYNDNNFVPQKDNNSIFSALLKKNLKPDIVIKPEVVMPKEKTMGPAQAKLKQLMKKNDKPISNITESKHVSKFDSHSKNTKKDERKDDGQIDQQIIQDYDEYAAQSFEKLSAAYESAIRQSIIGESYNIKESIRQSIKQSIQASASKIKQSIRQDIKQSFNNISISQMKQQIGQQISASFKKSKQSIQQIYEQVFQNESLSNSLSKSQSKFKKNIKQDSLSQSQSASKSFRMKTNVIKPQKLAQQILKKQKEIDQINDLHNKHIKEEITKQKSNLKSLKQNINKILSKQPKSHVIQQKNNNLYYNFKVQINRLLSSDKYQSRLKKLVSFLNVNDNIHPSKKYIDDLEDNVLKNIMQQVQNIRIGKDYTNQVQKIKKQYEIKLTEQLRMQEVNLRAEMNQKLHEKDFQLKKMIAQLQNRMMKRTFVPTGNEKMNYSGVKFEQYEVDSDYSIDSDNISWKADLWQLLPQIQKKKLYQKQTASVTKFLADIMVNQLKQQALQRSQLDISFQFPEQYNNLSSSFQKHSTSKSYDNNLQKQSKNESNNKEFQKKFEKKSQFLSDLPKLTTKVMNKIQNTSINSSQYEAKQQQSIKFEKTRKDMNQKNQMIKTLSQYKNIYLKKKIDVIRNILKVLNSKNAKTQQFLYSSIQEISILTERQYKKEHQLYIKAYQEQIIMSLLAINNKSFNKKLSVVEEQMKKAYDKIVVASQVSTAQKCYEKISLKADNNQFNFDSLTNNILKKMQITPASLDIPPSQIYMQLKTKKEQKAIKNEVVQQIVNILTAEFAKEFPKKKK